ncbi:rhodanese-like domain-containing protein [Streptomyces sp. NPDC005373]|uniref:sulfurtransferase n=1 Tax=Streptomyces sp. NPDC005373 TaxID=3156879 RepID=UPI0033A2AFC6
MSHFISVDDLAAALTTDTPPILLDLRFDPGAGSAPARFEKGHLPGARFVRLENIFADVSGNGGGAAPLPQPEPLEDGLRELGLDNDTDIVVYVDTTGSAAARAWWVLTWAGAERVRVLDGGIKAWATAGQDLVVDDDKPRGAQGSFTVRAGRLPSTDAAGLEPLVTGRGEAWVLIDTRRPPQFAGEEENPRTGHIPGAQNLPQPIFTQADGTVADRSAVLASLASVGADESELVLYCGAGVSSAYAVLALAEHGIPATLYAGSFSDWAADPSRPVEQG